MKKFYICILLFMAITPLFAQGESESSDFSYAVKLYNQEFYDLAAQQFIKFYNNYPNSSKIDEAKYYSGVSLFNLKDYYQARIEFQSLALEFPKSTRAGESWFKIGECYEKTGKPSEAVKAYETIKVLYPEHPLAPNGLYLAGNIGIEREEYEKSYQNFSSILERYSESGFYYPAMVKAGLCLARLDDLEKAKQYLQKALDSKPDEAVSAEANLILGRINAGQGYYTDARNRFLTVINNYSKSPQVSEAIKEISKIYIQEGDYNNAQIYLTKGLKDKVSAENSDKLRFLLADVYYLNGKFALAEKEYEQIGHVKNDSLKLILSFKKALAKKKQSLITQANELLGNALKEFNNKNSGLYSAIFDIYIDWLKDGRKYRLAISMLGDRINKIDLLEQRIKPTNRLVEFLIKTEQWHDIIRLLQPFLLIQDNYPEKDDVYYSLAYSFEKISDYSQAAYYYNQLITNFPASSYYSDALQRIDYLRDYSLIDQNVAVSKLAGLIGTFLNDKNDHLQFELGKIYFNDLKDYNSAENQFKQALVNDTAKAGDLYLYLGKTLLKKAYRRNLTSDETLSYLRSANGFFTKSIENISTCSRPDEASWLLVNTSVSIDTLPLAKEKNYIETLIKKYPASKLIETWYKSLAFDLAFDPAFQKDSIKYFELLINNYRNSDDYSAYLYGYARLMQEKNKENAINFYKKIASDYAHENEAADALHEVAAYYEEKAQFKDANTLYKNLLDTYYYSDAAVDARQKIGAIYLKAGSYQEAIDALNKQIHSPFITDYVLSKEFLPQTLYSNVFFLAKAYAGQGEYKRALENYKFYLNLAANGALRDDARFAMGEIYYSKNQFNVAFDNFILVSREDTDLYVRSRMYAAEIQFKNEEYKEAAANFNELSKLLQGKDAESDVSGKYIICLIRDGNLAESEKAIAAFKKNFNKSDHFFAQFTLEFGKYYRLNKDFNKAIKYFEQVKKKYKNSESVDDADYFLALTYLTLNKHEDALKILSNFSSNYPKSELLSAVYNTLGTIYFRSEKYDSAIAVFKNSLELSPDPNLEVQIMSNLIKTYSLTGFWDAAQGLARQYVEKFPNADDILDKKILIGQAFINLNQFQTGVEYLKKIKLEADSEREPEIQFYIGEALLKAGQYESAIAEFVKIPLLSKKTKLQWEASALYYSGQAYEKLGRITDAVRMYQEIVNRPGIDLILKKDAEKRIKQIQG
ncbi:MAG: tetratricopeptide repeat protein [Calditrichaceae bacterium]